MNARAAAIAEITSLQGQISELETAVSVLEDDVNALQREMTTAPYLKIPRK